MARNGEKAQSMLYRFREQQAADMGVSTRKAGDRRPRIAASVSSLHECERWRGDVLKEISRKVTKIQDSTLTDYEVRDLNDELNSLMREKRHWETQIVSLGGANYKRAQASMTDDAGREVPGTRGYKYFGRAKELPGVKELFTRGAQNATEESARNASFQMFRNQGPEYYGDIDEVDAELVREEDELARQEWAAAVAETAEILSIDQADIPYPLASSGSSVSAGAGVGAEGGVGDVSADSSAQSKSKGKRKTRSNGAGAGADGDADGGAAEDGSAQQTQAENGKEDAGAGAGAEADADAEGAKKAKTSNGNGNGAGGDASLSQSTPYNSFAASFGGVFDAQSLTAPAGMGKEDMSKVLLEVRKRALREEYGV